MKLKDVKELIGKVAPTLGAAIGGPFGGIAGTAIQAALGVSSEEAAYDLIKADPNALLELKKADIGFKQYLREAEIREDELEVQDRGSARSLFSINIWPQVLLSGMFVSGYFILLYQVLGGHMQPPENLRETMILLLGVLAAEVPRIMGFWFGSSLGSREKSARLSQYEA